MAFSVIQTPLPRTSSTSWGSLSSSDLPRKYRPPSKAPIFLDSSFTPSPTDLHSVVPLRSSNSPSSSPISDSGLLFRRKLLYLESLRVNSSAAIAKNPNLRSASIDSLRTVESCFRSMGLGRDDIGRILSMHPQLLTCDLRRDVYPVFDFLLNEVGIPWPHLRKALTRCPRLLVSSVADQLRPTFYFLQRLGFVGPHAISCQTTLLLVSSVENTLMPKIEFLQSMGFSYREVVKMVLRSPGLLTFSIEKNFKPKFEFFVNEMGRDVAELKDFPHYFSFSLEGRIRPRHKRLMGLGFKVSLSEMLTVSDGGFNDMLVELKLKSVEGLLR
ncbi:transcription termination factor MTEF1, chloroplastic [Nymphaea colorata]|uniref:Uncharacterized protein n=1 Tax=Nymphaea colorata TaxID=210225 RepID=A0A5K1AR70_9MAGN|nr:transcription termination factor MTEF1, chloroplastic [Nymphaea colorata]XP_049931994.1 transcription termination factor MTEF1, chloroplastic [Nymphaea colorata]XP_049931995.1 transcription termination factor MTEF1, chloroplastic [Nymphaea colorata]